jgi:hypothetical protein
VASRDRRHDRLWSKSSVSRYLGTLESDDIVERVQIGRRKLVGVPEEMPDAVPVADGPSLESQVWAPGTPLRDAGPTRHDTTPSASPDDVEESEERPHARRHGDRRSS